MPTAKCPVDDIINVVYSLALAGHDSTTNAMGNALRHLWASRSSGRRLSRIDP